jgi:H+/Cl- antiporter ClcA
MIMAGIAGGFGSVFGTPVAGAIFALEMGTIGRTDYAALMPCLTAALAGHWVTRHTGTQYAFYPTPVALHLGPGLALRWIVVGAAVAAVATGFIAVSHAISHHRSLRLPVRMFFGAVAVVMLWRLLGTADYLGLGDATIERAFQDTTLSPWAWLAKAAFTAVTLGSGFLGGEVTPLFFTGAALGNALAGPLNLPVDLAAGVCMAAIFGAAANAPLALIIMATELMGAALLPHVAVVTAVAYHLMGARSIYPAQRLSRDKLSAIPRQQLQALRDF